MWNYFPGLFPLDPSQNHGNLILTHGWTHLSMVGLRIQTRVEHEPQILQQCRDTEVMLQEGRLKLGDVWDPRDVVIVKFDE